MATLFSDAFGASLSGTNYTQSTGSSWSVPSGGTAGYARCGQNNNAPAILVTTTTAHAAVADVKASVTRIAGTGFDGGPIARYSGTAGNDNGYYADVVQADGAIYIYRRVAGADSAALVTASGLTLANNDIYGIEVSGTGATVTLKIWHNGSAIATGTDTSGSRITAAGQTGILTWAAPNQDFDSFLVEDAVVGGGSPVAPRAQAHYRRRRGY